MKNNILQKIKIALSNCYNVKKIVRNIVEEENLISMYKVLSIESDRIGTTEESYDDYPVIVSLTTYGDRIYSVYLTIESLLQQSLKPNKIILWLSENEYTEKTIPGSLKKLKNRGLSIQYCEDLRSYKKLIPTVQLYPDSIIITTDDDVIYPTDFVELFYSSYQGDKNCVYFNRGHKMTFDSNKKVKPYSQWEHEVNDSNKSLFLVPTGNGGVLYPPNCFHPDITKKDVFMNLCPTTDDIWFKFMTLMKGIPSKRCDVPARFHDLSALQDNSLGKINHHLHNLNDACIEELHKKYNVNNILNKM